MPRLSKFSTLILFAVLTVAGFALVPLLSIQFLPTALAPSLTVRYAWPEAGPEVIEREVTSPLEGAFSLVDGVQGIYSVSGNGTGSIRLDLDKHSDRDYLRFEVAAKIRQLFPRLPQGLRFPQIFLNNPEQEADDRPILTWSLAGNDPLLLLYGYASETLTPQLALTPGISRIEVTGGNRYEWAITFDAPLLRRTGLDREDIQRALQENFGSEALGTVEENERVLFVKLSHFTGIWDESSSPAAMTKTAERAFQKEDFEKIALAKAGNRIIRLGDVATVSWQEQKPQQFYRINGQGGVRLLMYPETGVNTIRLAGQVKAQVAALRSQLPASYRLYLDDDATEFLATELLKIRQRTLWSLGILLGFVLLAYRSWRYLAVVLLSLAANLGLAALFYYALGVELHLYALAGITVSFGIIIDNSIVMMHHLRKQGNLSVFPALLASTLTTVAALVVIWFLPEEWQLNLAEFARVLAINLGVSLAVALWLIPALMERFGIFKTTALKRSFFEKMTFFRVHHYFKKTLLLLLRFRKTAILLVVLLFGLPVFLLPGKVEGWDFYNKTLGSEWYLEHGKPVVNKWLGGTLRLFAWFVWEGGSFRQPEETVLHVQGAMPPGATLAQMNEVFEKMDAYLAQYPVEVKKYVTTVSSSEFAATQVFFNENHDLSFPHQLKNRLIAHSLNLGGVRWNIFGVGQGFSNTGGSGPPSFRVKMLGYNKDELQSLAERFSARLLAHPRIREVNTEANINWWDKDRYAFEMTLDRRSLAERNIPPWRLRQVFDDFNKTENPDLYLPGAVPVRLANSRAAANDRWQLENVAQPVDSLLVFFPATGTLEKRKTASAIHKSDQQYIRMVEFEYTGSHRFGSLFLDEKLAEMSLETPPGYSLEEGRYRRNLDRERQYGLLALVAGLIFFICAVTFESLRQAAAIVLLIPLSFIGIFLTFYWFGFPFDQGGYTSFLLVSGLTVNGLILIVNDFNGLRKRHPHRNSLDLYLKAFYQKFTPITLSILSTALGLLPFTLHGQREPFWFALAVGGIGGLLFSLVVVALFIPLVFVKAR